MIPNVPAANWIDFRKSRTASTTSYTNSVRMAQVGTRWHTFGRSFGSNTLCVKAIPNVAPGNGASQSRDSANHGKSELCVGVPSLHPASLWRFRLGMPVHFLSTRTWHSWSDRARVILLSNGDKPVDHGSPSRARDGYTITNAALS